MDHFAGLDVDHFGRPAIRREYAATHWIDRGENSEPSESMLFLSARPLTVAIREPNGVGQRRHRQQAEECKKQFVIGSIAA